MNLNHYNNVEYVGCWRKTDCVNNNIRNSTTMRMYDEYIPMCDITNATYDK